MTEDRMALVELLQKSGDPDFLRAVAKGVLQILMEADVEGLIGAGRHERSAERLNYRDTNRDPFEPGSARRACASPKLRQGLYFPPFLGPRRTAEKALVSCAIGISRHWQGGSCRPEARQRLQPALPRHVVNPMRLKWPGSRTKSAI